MLSQLFAIAPPHSDEYSSQQRLILKTDQELEIAAETKRVSDTPLYRKIETPKPPHTLTNNQEDAYFATS